MVVVVVVVVVVVEVEVEVEVVVNLFNLLDIIIIHWFRPVILVRKSVYLFGVLMTHYNQKYIKFPSREYSHLLKFSVLFKEDLSTFLASSF